MNLNANNKKIFSISYLINLLLLLIFLFNSKNYNSQISQNFNATSTGNVTTSVSATSLYQSGTGCGEKWEIVSTTQSSSIKCASCSGRWAEMYYAYCSQDEILWSDAFTPNASSINISFDYRFNYYSSSDEFWVYLYNETDDANVATLLNWTVDKNESYSNNNYSLTGSNSSTDSYRLKFRYKGNGGWGASIDNISVTANGPNITCGSLTGSFSSCSGSAGSNQSFTCEGSNLTADISIAPPSGYEISTNSDFSSNVAIGASAQSLTLAHSGGTVNSTTIYARLTSSASNGASGDISCTSSGASTVNVATASGTVNSLPTPNAGIDISVAVGESVTMAASHNTSINYTFSEDFESISNSIEKTSDDSDLSDMGIDNKFSWDEVDDDAMLAGSNNTTMSNHDGTNANGRGGVNDDYIIISSDDNTNFGGSALKLTIDLSTCNSASNTSLTFYANDQGDEDHNSSSYGGLVMDEFLVSFDNGSTVLEPTGNANFTYNSGNTTVGLSEMTENTWYDFAFDVDAYATANSVSDLTNTIFYWTQYDNYVGDGSDGIAIDDISVSCTGTPTMSWSTTASAGTGGFTTTIEDPQITASADATHAGNYTLSVTDGNGCVGTDVMTVTVAGINTWDGSSSTSWTTASNWSTGSVPGSTDPVVIANVTNDPVIDANDQVGSITVQSGGVLTINSSVILTASSVELQSGGDIVISNGELNCTGKFDHDGDLTMSGSGVLDIDGEYESSASATEIISGGTIEVAGEWDGANDDAFTPTGGTVTMNNSADKNLAQHASSNFFNLTIANSGGDVDVTAALDIDGDLTINASADLDIGGGNANIELAGSLSNSGTFTTSGESITFDGASGDKTCSAISDADLDIVVNKTSTGKVTFAGTCSFDEVTVTDGIFAITSNTVTADNNINIADGAELEIGSGTFNADGAINANSSGEIDFTGAGKLVCSGAVTGLGDLDHEQGTVELDLATQSFGAETFYNLTISTAGTKSATGAITVNNDLTTANTTDCKLDMQGNNLTLLGDLNVGATNGLDLSDVSCVFTMGGSSAQSVTHAGTAAATSTLLSENFSSGTISEGNGSSFLSQDASNSSHSGSYGYWTLSTTSSDADCSGCSSYRAYIVSGPGDGSDNILWVNEFTPTTNTLSISFNYGHDNRTHSSDNGDAFKVYLDASSGSDVVLVNHANNAGSGYGEDALNQSYSNSSVSVTAGVTYKFVCLYENSDYDNGMYGAAIDNILVTEQAATSHFRNLTVNNSAGFSLSSDVTIEGTLNLTSGSINTNGNSLHVTSTGSVTGSKGTSPCNCIYPDAYSQELTTTNAVEFKVGNNAGTERKSIWIQPENANSVTFSADFVGSVHGDAADCGTGLDHISTASYYDISRTSGSENAKVKLSWFTNDQVTDYSNLLLAHYDGSQWQKVVSTPTGSNTSGTIISDAFQSSFSPFALGSSNSGNPLPIDLVSFTGICENAETELEFIVASQINNDYFTIERSIDNKKWKTIGEIPGLGNTSTQMTYNYTDYSPMQGLSYYRLSQTDYDGESETFAPITVTCEGDAIGGYNAYPNPAKDELMIDIELDTYQGDDVQLQLIDVNGRVAKQQPIELERGFNHFEVELNELPNGIYLLQFTGTKNHIKERRIIKQ